MSRSVWCPRGPLLIGWAEVGPALLHAINTGARVRADYCDGPSVGKQAADALVEQAQKIDAEHLAAHNRPISAESPRKHLHVGTRSARALVTEVRAKYEVTALHADS